MVLAHLERRQGGAQHGDDRLLSRQAGRGPPLRGEPGRNHTTASERLAARARVTGLRRAVFDPKNLRSIHSVSGAAT
jgi:hypothetical protein